MRLELCTRLWYFNINPLANLFICKGEYTMASYNRAFLVPYLQDICSLYYAQRKLEALMDHCDRQAEQILMQARDNVEKPEFQKTMDDSFPWVGGCGCLIAVMSLIWIPIAVIDSMVYVNGTPPVIPLFTMLIGLAIFIGVLKSHRTRKAEEEQRAREINEIMQEQYLFELSEAEKAVKSQIDKIYEQRDFYERQYHEVDDLLTKAYQADIIPTWYRDMYPAVYLYDWFKHSRSDNLDMALNTLVLEQIKDKLDIIIQNQMEQLINQRIMIANQNKAMEQAERHHVALMSKLDEMQALEEERNTYLSMIETNTAVDSFFSMATYLKS